MDKETLSNYGWIVICVMVMAVMLAFASPFGNFVADAIKSTTQGLFDTNQNALDSAGIEIMQQEFEEMLNGPSATDSPVKFGQPYQMTMVEDGLTLTMEYVFYADGSATMWIADAMAEYMPVGTFTYSATEILDSEGYPISISADGTTLYDPNDETLVMTVKSVSKGSPKTNTSYVADPNGLIGVTGVDIQIGTDSSLTIYQNGVAGETIPASAIQWYENYYTVDGEVAGAIYPDGSKITIEGIVCVSGHKYESTTPLKFGEKYICTMDNASPDGSALGHWIIFYADGSTSVEVGDSLPSGTFTYTQTEIQMKGQTGGNKLLISSDGKTITQTQNGEVVQIFILYEQTFVPDGAQYYISSTGTMLNPGDALPETVSDGDMYVYGDYVYAYNYVYNPFEGNVVTNESIKSSASPELDLTLVDGWSVRVIDTTKTSYGEMLSEINGEPVTNLFATYYSCWSMNEFPSLADSITTIGYAAFHACGELTSITIPSNITAIDALAFDQCGKVIEVSMHDNVTKIGPQAFISCTRLKSIKMSNSVSTLKQGTFAGCSSLESFIVPNSVTSIGPTVFQGCKLLSNIDLGANLQSIGANAFMGCESLQSIVFPQTLNSIGMGPFHTCSNISYFEYKGTIEEWNSITFEHPHWYAYTVATELKCSDGTVSLS